MSENDPHRCVLGPDCEASGQLSIEGDGTIMGRFEGTIRVGGTLELTDSSNVTGTIVAGAVRLGGRAKADIIAEHGVELLCGSVLSGRLFTKRLSVADGASFDGPVVAGAAAMDAASDLLGELEPPLSFTDGACAGDQPDARRREHRAADLEVHTTRSAVDQVLAKRGPQPVDTATTTTGDN